MGWTIQHADWLPSYTQIANLMREVRALAQGKTGSAHTSRQAVTEKLRKLFR